jgi:hypothetical protein
MISPMKWLVLALLAGCHGGSFDHDRFDRIVDAVRARVTIPGEHYRFQLNDALDASSLAAVPPDKLMGRGDGRGRVRAIVTAHGELAVSIETNNNGHAGEFGSKTPGFPLPSSSGRNSTASTRPGSMTAGSAGTTTSTDYGAALPHHCQVGCSRSRAGAAQYLYFVAH